MKEIFIEVRDFIKKDFNLFAYAYTFVLLGILLYFNYKFNFEKTYIDRTYGSYKGFWVYPLYYLTPYYFVMIPVLFIKNEQHKLLQKEFWVKSIIYIGTFGITVAFWQHRKWFDFSEFPAADRFFILRIFDEIKRFVPFLIIFYAVKRYYDKEDTHLLGLRFKGNNYRPFFLMLLLMLPLIALASFQTDFQHTYPQFKYWFYGGAFEMTKLQTMGVFEMAYGLDFVSVELLFRGALIIGMAKILGKDAVLPMAAAYVILHFGKPLGEAISSFFGGFILGVHSLSKRNIFGGIVIHVGIAYLMEIAAVLQHFYG